MGSVFDTYNLHGVFDANGVKCRTVDEEIIYPLGQIVTRLVGGLQGWTVDEKTINLGRVFPSAPSQTREEALGP